MIDRQLSTRDASRKRKVQCCSVVIIKIHAVCQLDRTAAEIKVPQDRFPGNEYVRTDLIPIPPCQRAQNRPEFQGG